MCFKGVLNPEYQGGLQSTSDFDIETMAYQLEFKNTSSYYSSCKLCEKSSCKGCLVPFEEATTVTDMMEKLGLCTNDTLFS